MNNSKIFSWDNVFATIVVLMVLKFLPIIFTIDFLDPINNTIQDFNPADVVFSQFRDYKSVPPDTNIVLVNYSHLDRMGIAQQIEIINSYSPCVIGIDGFFRNLKNHEMDSALATAMSKVKNLVLVSKLRYNHKIDECDSLETTNPYFNQYAKTGFSNIITSASDFRTTRAMPIQGKYRDKTELLFSVKIASIYNPKKAKIFLDRDNEEEIVNFRRNIDMGKYRTLDVNDVFNKKDSLQFLKDKIVLIGFLGPDINTLVTEDIFFTPMNHVYIGKTYPDMYGVVVHANLLSMILNEEFINTIPYWVKIVIIFLIIYFNMALFSYISHRFEFWYETVNVVIIATEIVLLFGCSMLSFYWLNFELGFNEAALYGIIFSATGFEIYKGTIKPLVLSNWEKFFEKKPKAL